MEYTPIQEQPLLVSFRRLEANEATLNLREAELALFEMQLPAADSLPELGPATIIRQRCKMARSQIDYARAEQVLLQAQESRTQLQLLHGQEEQEQFYEEEDEEQLEEQQGQLDEQEDEEQLEEEQLEEQQGRLDEQEEQRLDETLEREFSPRPHRLEPSSASTPLSRRRNKDAAKCSPSVTSAHRRTNEVGLANSDP